jgi:hypothetical protein
VLCVVVIQQQYLHWTCVRDSKQDRDYSLSSIQVADCMGPDFVAQWHKGLVCNWTFAMEALSSENLLDVVNLTCGSVECDKIEGERQ